MLARDRTKPKTEYQGRPTQVLEACCPCRSCFHPHDWKTPVPVYTNGQHVDNRYPPDMRCATRENRGCQDSKPEPVHVYASVRSRVCGRCGARRERESR